MNKDINYYMSLPYPVLLTPLSEEDGGGLLAEIPLLPGCMSDGETPNEAMQMIEKAKHLWLTVAIEHNRPIAEPETATA